MANAGSFAGPLNFSVDASDHCETPRAAYADIAPLLDVLARRSVPGAPARARLAIYDPYFCAGGAKARLASLGFERVYNRNEDFYAAASAGRCPAHDVLLTNPPFSGDHLRRILHFATKGARQRRQQRQEQSPAPAPPPLPPQQQPSQQGAPPRRPWALLLPSHCYCQDWFRALMAAEGEQPLFLCPKARYSFHSHYALHSEGGAQGGAQGGAGAKYKAAKSAEMVTPFPTIWVIGGVGAEVREELVRWFASAAGREAHGGTCTLAASEAELPKSIRKLERYAKNKGKGKLEAKAKKKRAREPAAVQRPPPQKQAKKQTSMSKLKLKTKDKDA